MYIVVITWIYVAFMMAVAEATNTNGTVLGAAFTFLLYGVLPCALLIYIMGTPSRKRAIKAREAMEAAAASERSATASLTTPDAHSHSPADSIAAVRKEA